jgi:hypothetical protein
MEECRFLLSGSISGKKVQFTYFAPIYRSIIFGNQTVRLTSYLAAVSRFLGISWQVPTKSTQQKMNFPRNVPDLKIRETER